MSVSFKDYNQGKTHEDFLLPFFRRMFNDEKIDKQKNPYSVMDFKGHNLFIELKKRNCLLSKYESSMIGFNKIQFCSRLYDYIDCYFFFQYDDFLVYYKYDNSHFFQVSDGGRCDRGEVESSKYVYIPIEILVKV
jgi:hypothetical protein